MYIETMLRPILNYFATVHFSVSNTYDKVAYEVLFTSEKQRLQFFDYITEDGLHDQPLVLGRTLLPETILLENHVEVVLDGVEGTIVPHFVHGRRQVVGVAGFLHGYQPHLNLILLLL